MKICIMQPYFFPYIGYFDLINHVDLFVVMDHVQYQRRGWINRNRVLHQNQSGWQYIKVPVKKVSIKTPIKDIEINESISWVETLLGQLNHYHKNAPYAYDSINFLEKIFNIESNSLLTQNIHILESCCHRLGVDFKYILSSDILLDYNHFSSPEKVIIGISKYLGATEYYNLPGGSKLYNKDIFKMNKLNLKFISTPHFKYKTGSYTFVDNLSIIDLLMWNKPEVIHDFLAITKRNR